MYYNYNVGGDRLKKLKHKKRQAINNLPVLIFIIQLATAIIEFFKNFHS